MFKTSFSTIFKRCYASHNPFDNGHLKSLEQSIRQNPELFERLQKLARMVKEKKLINAECAKPMSSMEQVKLMAKVMKDEELRTELMAIAPLLKGSALDGKEKMGFLSSLFKK
jgi:hypothetical protein